MQVTLKQSEITAAIAAYLTNVLGVANVSPDTLSVTYKQGRSDKNGMTAELDIEAPAYEAKKAFVSECSPIKATLSPATVAELGNDLASDKTPTEVTSASVVSATEVAPVAVVRKVEPAAEAAPVYDGERRAEPRDEAPITQAVVTDEVAQALAEDALADVAEPAVEEPQAETAAPLFG